jgi:hypothetical protein
MQLTLDHLTGAGSTIIQVHEKWAMLDFLDRHIDRTGLMVYESDSYHFRIPFQFGDFCFASGSKPAVRNFCQLSHFSSKHSAVFLKHTLTSLMETENGYKAVYSRFVGSGKERTVEEDIAGQAYFLLRDYPLQSSRFPKLNASSTQDEVFSALKKATVHIKARVNGDWLHEIISIPFTIDYIGVSGDVITITGSHDTEFSIKGFKGIRVQADHGYIIFDVYDQIHGYSLTFHLMNSKGR